MTDESCYPAPVNNIYRAVQALVHVDLSYCKVCVRSVPRQASDADVTFLKKQGMDKLLEQ